VSRFALVIGNSAYKYAAELPNPRNDARAIAKVLRQLQFEVDLTPDAGLRKFRSALESFNKKIVSAEAALFYFAGHGLQLKGNNYLLPIDARVTHETHLDWNTVQVDQIIQSMAPRARSSLLFLDACRDDSITRSLAEYISADERTRDLPRSGFAEMRSTMGTFIAFATAPNTVAFDGTGRHSPFTEALLDHITTPDITVGDMMIAVRNQVIRATRGRQSPWEHSNLREWFYFNAGATAEQVEMDRHWREISRAPSSLSVIEAFIQQSPKYRHIDHARHVIVQRIASCNDIDELEHFLQQYIDSPRFPLVNARLSLLVWRTLKRSRDPDDLRRFIANFHGTSEAEEARTKLSSLLWPAFRATEDIGELDAFIEEFDGTSAGQKATQRKQHLLRKTSDVAQSGRDQFKFRSTLRSLIVAAVLVAALSLLTIAALPNAHWDMAALGGSALTLLTIAVSTWVRRGAMSSRDCAIYMLGFSIAVFLALFIAFDRMNWNWLDADEGVTAGVAWALIVSIVTFAIVIARRRLMKALELTAHALVLTAASAWFFAELTSRPLMFYLPFSFAFFAFALYWWNGRVPFARNDPSDTA
jgi:uncharacterized caspase-like protein